MTSMMSRRNFLLRPVGSSENTNASGFSNNPDVVIGRISDFPIGEKKLLPLLQITIESFPEGLRAGSVENNETYYLLKSNQIGELVVNRTQIWPANQVYSIFTNQPAHLDTILKEPS